MLGYTTFGQKVYATRPISAPPLRRHNTNQVRVVALMLSAWCATMAGIINVAFFRSFNQSPGSFASSTRSPR